MKLFKSIVLCLCTTISFSACSNVEKQKEGINVIDFKNPKKVCFGRIEMTVPKETKVEYSNFNYNGSDTFTYIANDSVTNSATFATITITYFALWNYKSNQLFIREAIFTNELHNTNLKSR